MKYAAPKKVIQNPHKNVYLQNQNIYNYAQPTGNFRTTYNPSKLKSNPFNNQIFDNELVEETYVIDPKTGQKIILKSPKPITQNNNNQIYNQHVNTNPNTYKVENGINNSVYQDLSLTIDPFSLAKDSKKKSHDIYYHETNPIIENLNQIVFNPQGYFEDSDIDKLDIKKSATLLTVSSIASLPYKFDYYYFE